MDVQMVYRSIGYDRTRLKYNYWVSVGKQWVSPIIILLQIGAASAPMMVVMVKEPTNIKHLCADDVDQEELRPCKSLAEYLIVFYEGVSLARSEGN